MFYLWEERSENRESLSRALFALIFVSHRTLPVQRPKADFGVNLEYPLLNFWRDGVIHFLNLWRDSPCLKAQASSRAPLIGGAAFSVAVRSQCCSARATAQALPILSGWAARLAPIIHTEKVG